MQLFEVLDVALPARQTRKPMLILGHRGASTDFPENTREAFVAAVDQGADGVELDVIRCGSGELVVCHDDELSRLAKKRWLVRRTPWWKLKQADVGSALGFPPARIPLLEEVLDALPPSFLINVELKCEGLDDQGLSVEVGSLLEHRHQGDRVWVSSFNPLCLIRLGHAFPSVKRGLLIDPHRRWFPQAWICQPLAGPAMIHPHHSQCTRERVNFWHARGLKVVSWTVDDPTLARSLAQQGVDILITNRPKAIRAALETSLKSRARA